MVTAGNRHLLLAPPVSVRQPARSRYIRAQSAALRVECVGRVQIGTKCHEPVQRAAIRNADMAPPLRRDADQSTLFELSQCTAYGFDRQAQIIANFGARHAELNRLGIRRVLALRRGPAKQKISHPL